MKYGYAITPDPGTVSMIIVENSNHSYVINLVLNMSQIRNLQTNTMLECFYGALCNMLCTTGL